MKKPFKVPGASIALLLIALFAAIVLGSAGTQHSIGKANALRTADTTYNLLERFQQRIVPVDTAFPYIGYFALNCKLLVYDTLKGVTANLSVKFSGSKIRNADVFASLGLLSQNGLYTYTECEKIQMRTALGYNPAGNVLKVYVHPVAIDQQNRVTDTLVFDTVGNLYKFNFRTRTGTLYNPGKCSLPPGAAKQTKSPIAQSVPASKLYVVDLNNPCPPCQ